MAVVSNPPPRRAGSRLATAAIPAVLILLTALALALRIWRLNVVPPGLWWDEATQGLDAAELLRGQFRLFYPSALGKEPLYIYLTAPIVAAWYGAPAAVRAVGAVLSALMVPALFACGRALFPERPRAGAWTGLAAGALWATNFWAQSISRIGFQVNALPLILTVAVVAWLNYTRRPSRSRSLAFGTIAGLALYTYLAARITPLLWLILFLALPRVRRGAMTPTLKYAALAFALVALPLAAHFALHPADFLGRISTFGVAQGTAAVIPPDPIKWSIEGSLKAFFGLTGDPIARHNLPDQPSFTVPAAGLFALGLLSGVGAILLRRHQGGLTVIAWWLVLCVPAILSRSSTPHYPRLLGALPAAILIAALPFGYAAALEARRWRLGSALPAVFLTGLLVFETAHVTQAYFVRWAQQTDLYTSYQQDTWAFAEQVKADAGAVGAVALHEGYGAQLDYAFSKTPIFQLAAGEPDVAGRMDAALRGAGGKRIISVAWGEAANQDADSRRLLQHYLAREGELIGKQAFRGFDLLAYRLGPNPQFAAPGRQVSVNAPYEAGVTLVEARWGAAYPNPDRSGASAAAGTPLWVTLTWRLDTAQPTFRAAVDLLDGAGRRLDSAEMELMDLRQQQGAWQASGTTQTHHLVLIPPTLAPGGVSLAARLYDAQSQRPVLLTQPVALVDAGTLPDRLSVPFARAQATPPVRAPSPEMGAPVVADLGGGLTLLGADPWPASVRPGDTVTARLYWSVRDEAARGRALALMLQGQGTGDTSAGAARFTIPQSVQPPAVIHTDVDLPVAADTAPGVYELAVSDETGERATLGNITIGGRARVWEAPPVSQAVTATFANALALRGVDAPPSVVIAAGETVTVTLVWQVMEPPGGDLARFLHLLGPDGRPLAQRDGAPCAGWDAATPDVVCPASSWLPGEVLIDRVALTLPADLPPGRYPLATGWYDAASLQRLPALDAKSRRLQDDLLRLPVELVVGEGS